MSEQFFPRTVPVFENILQSTLSAYPCLLTSLIGQLANFKTLRGVDPQRPKIHQVIQVNVIL